MRMSLTELFFYKDETQVEQLLKRFPNLFSKDTKTIEQVKSQLKDKITTLGEDDTVKLLRFLSDRRFNLLDDFREDLLVRYFSLTQDPLVVQRMVRSALKDGFYVKDNEVILNSKEEQEQQKSFTFIDQVIENNPNKFESDETKDLFRSIVNQVIKSGKIREKDIEQSLGDKSKQKDMLKLILKDNDSDWAYRIKAWLFLLNERNLKDYGIDKKYPGLNFETTVVNPQTGRKQMLGQLESNILKGFMSQFSNDDSDKISLQKWLKDNKIIETLDDESEKVYKISKLLKGTKYQNLLNDSGNDFKYWFLKKLEKTPISDSAGYEAVVKALIKVFEEVSLTHEVNR